MNSVLSKDESLRLCGSFIQSGRLKVVKGGDIQFVNMGALDSFLKYQSAALLPDVDVWIEWLNLLDNRVTAYEMCIQTPLNRFPRSNPENLFKSHLLGSGCMRTSNSC